MASNFDTASVKLNTANTLKIQILGSLRKLSDAYNLVGKGFDASREGKHAKKAVDIAIKALTTKVEKPAEFLLGEDRRRTPKQNQQEVDKLDALLDELRTCEEMLGLGK